MTKPAIERFFPPGFFGPDPDSAQAPAADSEADFQSLCETVPPETAAASRSDKSSTDYKAAVRQAKVDLINSLPDLDDISEIWDDMPDPPPELITGVLRKGHKMIISGASKKGKSMLLLQLAVAIASGGHWIGINCIQGSVLYVNLEIDKRSFNKNRVRRVCEARTITPEKISHNLKVWTLRGYVTDLETLVDAIITKYSEEHFIAVIIDPIYKVMIGDENKAGDMAKICNQLDRIATELNAAVIYTHHFSKGSQSGKVSIDRASGSGVFARDPDAIVTYTEIESDTDDPAFRLEFTLREFKGPKPIEIRYKYPIHTVAENGELANAPIIGEAKKKSHEENLIEFVNKLHCAFDYCSMDRNDGPVSMPQLYKWMKMKQPQFSTWYKEASENGLTYLVKHDEKGKPSYFTIDKDMKESLLENV